MKILAALFFYTASLHAIILEDWLHTGILEDCLKHKKVGYYLGSFDPIHKGHEATAKEALNQGFCDYVLIYPAWGGDSYKTRADVNVRLDMLFSLFRDHPKIIVTRLIPKDLQAALTIANSDHLTVKPAFEGMEFIGLIGSDIALDIWNNREGASTYMSGTTITEKYEAHTFGGVIALPVSSYIVAIRKEDDLRPLQGILRGKKIVGTIENQNERFFSSSECKKSFKKGEPVDSMISQEIADIIEKYELYRLKEAYHG